MASKPVVEVVLECGCIIKVVVDNPIAVTNNKFRCEQTKKFQKIVTCNFFGEIDEIGVGEENE